MRIDGGYRRVGLAVVVAIGLLVAGCGTWRATAPAPIASSAGPTAASQRPTLEASVDPVASAAPTDGPAPGLARFGGDGWHFDYPATWQRYASVQSGVYANELGFLTNEELDVERACDDSDGTQHCQVGPRHGSPGGVLMEITVTRCAWGCIHTWRSSDEGFMRLDGVPATSVPGSDRNWEYRTINIADPADASTTLTIRSSIRRPLLPESEAAVDKVIASWRWDPPFVPLDPNDKAAFVAQAVREAKAVDPTYACVPVATDTTQTANVRSLGDDQLRRSLKVTCSVKAWVTSQIYWLIRMEVAWDAQGGSKANADVRKVWLTRDGVAMWRSDRKARPPYCCSEVLQIID